MRAAMQRSVKESVTAPSTAKSLCKACARVGRHRWPPVRWWLKRIAAWVTCLQAWSLEQLERWALRSDTLQRFMINRHERAFRALLPALQRRPLHRVGIIGGGLFPRTVMVLGCLLPESRLVVVDASARNIDAARDYLERHYGYSAHVGFVEGRFDPVSHQDFDLIVIPLGFLGDRAALYREPMHPAVIVHDWFWRVRGQAGVVVSYLLLKRLNLVIHMEAAG